MILRLPPRLSPCAGRVPGDRRGLSRARLDPAEDLHRQPLPAGSGTLPGPATRPSIAAPHLACPPPHTPRPVAPLGPAFNAWANDQIRSKSP